MAKSSTTRRTTTRRLAPLVGLLLASTASAATVSLSSFQFIASNGVPLGCIVAYNTPLTGCTSEGFQQRTCSATCVASLERITTNLASACESVNPADGSLLDLAVSGMLVQTLCPEVGDDPVPPTTTSGRVTTTTTLRFSTSPASSSTFSSTRTTLSSSRTSSTPLAADPPVQSESSESTTAAPAATTTAANGGNGQVISTAATTTSADVAEETQDFPGGSGGGSPFDAVQITSDAASSRRTGSFKSIGIALGAAVVGTMFAL